jgi:NADPH2:quinone reductase
VHTHEEFLAYTKELFAIVAAGDLNLSVHGEYELSTEGIRQAQLDISTLSCFSV